MTLSRKYFEHLKMGKNSIPLDTSKQIYRKLKYFTDRISEVFQSPLKRIFARETDIPNNYACPLSAIIAEHSYRGQLHHLHGTTSAKLTFFQIIIWILWMTERLRKRRRFLSSPDKRDNSISYAQIINYTWSLMFQKASEEVGPTTLEVELWQDCSRFVP